MLVCVLVRVVIALLFLVVLYASPSKADSTLVNVARQYIGTNPTGRASVWCGAFMDLVLRKAGRKGGGNLASAYARYGKRIEGPRVGAIAVMGRKGGGHVGVVSGFNHKGEPLIISGNTWDHDPRRRVLERPYPKRRIYAYVLPE